MFLGWFLSVTAAATRCCCCCYDASKTYWIIRIDPIFFFYFWWKKISCTRRHVLYNAITFFAVWVVLFSGGVDVIDSRRPTRRVSIRDQHSRRIKLNCFFYFKTFKQYFFQLIPYIRVLVFTRRVIIIATACCWLCAFVKMRRNDAWFRVLKQQQQWNSLNSSYGAAAHLAI
jgi:uncharacterized membrane protein